MLIFCHVFLLCLVFLLFNYFYYHYSFNNEEKIIALCRIDKYLNRSDVFHMSHFVIKKKYGTDASYTCTRIIKIAMVVPKRQKTTKDQHGYLCTLCNYIFFFTIFFIAIGLIIICTVVILRCLNTVMISSDVNTVMSTNKRGRDFFARPSASSSYSNKVSSVGQCVACQRDADK